MRIVSSNMVVSSADAALGASAMDVGVTGVPYPATTSGCSGERSGAVPSVRHTQASILPTVTAGNSMVEPR